VTSDEGESATDAELARLASVNLNLLVPMMALLDERSVTAAAAKVGLSQPAMSHALQRMRKLLGDDLILRQGSSMVLTPRALALVGPLRRVLHQALELVAPSEFNPAVDRRVITIAMTTSTVLVIGSALASLLAERAPNAELRLRTENMSSPTVFTDDGVDVVLLSEGLESPYPRELLYDDRWVVIAPGSAPADASALELLQSLPHIMFDSQLGRNRAYQVLDEQEISYTVRTRVTDYRLIPHLIARSGGVAVHRYQVAALFAELLDIRIEEFPFPVPSLGIEMVWNPRLSDRHFISWLRDLLREAADPLNRDAFHA
jgi:DNA-binding transcriptional LysR family regulator